MTNEEAIREAIMRLFMCANKECVICKYKDRPVGDLPSDACKERSIKNASRLAHEFLKFEREEKQTGWISVKDRLPDQELLEYWKRYSQRSVEVLVMIEGASHSTTLTWDGNRFSDDCHNEYEVTHWMPLPEPPGDSDAQD